VSPERQDNSADKKNTGRMMRPVFERCLVKDCLVHDAKFNATVLCATFTGFIVGDRLCFTIAL